MGTKRITPERAVQLLLSREQQYQRDAQEKPKLKKGYGELEQAMRMGREAIEALQKQISTP